MTEPAGLFDLPDGAVVVRVDPAKDPGLSADRRRTLRRAAALAAGRHPLEGGLLHPDGPPVGDRQAPGPRCRTCAHLCAQGGTAGDYLKCGLIGATRGPGTDVRAWWPACRRYQEQGE